MTWWDLVAKDRTQALGQSPCPSHGSQSRALRPGTRQHLPWNLQCGRAWDTRMDRVKTQSDHLGSEGRWLQGIPGGLLTLPYLAAGPAWTTLSPPLPCRITSSTWSPRDSSQGRASVHTTPSWTQPQPSSVSAPPWFYSLKMWPLTPEWGEWPRVNMLALNTPTGAPLGRERGTDRPQ